MKHGSVRYRLVAEVSDSSYAKLHMRRLVIPSLIALLTFIGPSFQWHSQSISPLERVGVDISSLLFTGYLEALKGFAREQNMQFDANEIGDGSTNFIASLESKDILIVSHNTGEPDHYLQLMIYNKNYVKTDRDVIAIFDELIVRIEKLNGLKVIR